MLAWAARIVRAVMDKVRDAVGLKTRSQRIADEDLVWLMGTVRGRRFVWRLLSEAGVFRQPYAGNAEDTAFRCGEMNAGQRLLNQVMSVCPHEYMVMANEAVAEKEQNARADRER